MDALDVELRNLQAFCNECKILMAGSYQPPDLESRYADAQARMKVVMEKIAKRDQGRDGLLTR